MRIMLDTNIQISIIFFPSGVTREFTRKVGLGNRIVLCGYVIEELWLVVDKIRPSDFSILLKKFHRLILSVVRIVLL